MIRVYDTNDLWRYDEIRRIRYLEAEIADMQTEIDRQQQNAVARPRRTPLAAHISLTFSVGL